MTSDPHLMDTPDLPSPINILLVEDNPADVDLALRALRRAKLQNRVWTVGDGVEALEFLRSHASPAPDLVLLDLQLPKVDGREVLLRMREDPRLKALPVIVLTSSDAEHEHLAALEANAFLTKPVSFERLGDAVRAIAGLGWAIVKLPATPPAHVTAPRAVRS
jgi:CheY-like chemotaxis protein